MLVKTTLRMVVSVKPAVARLITSRVGFIGAAAQVSTHPELLAEAIGCFGARATAAPIASAAAATKKPLRRRAPRSGIIRFGPPGETATRGTGAAPEETLRPRRRFPESTGGGSRSRAQV